MTTPSSQQPMIYLRRLLSATPQEVFEAWLDPESLREWMCPEALTAADVQVDTRVGGLFRIVMRRQAGEFVHTGEYREIRPPERLVFTWRSHATHWKDSLVTVELSAQGEHTELILTHELLPDEQATKQHTHGWQGITDKLALYFSHRKEVVYGKP